MFKQNKSSHEVALNTLQGKTIRTWSFVKDNFASFWDS